MPVTTDFKVSLATVVTTLGTLTLVITLGVDVVTTVSL